MDISVDLRQRRLRVFNTTIKLSNESIRHLRELGDEEFNNKTAEDVVSDLVQEQVIPFLHTANRSVTENNIEEEINEAFQTHLYVYYQRTI